jgi:acyl-CoA thioesterase-2
VEDRGPTVSGQRLVDALVRRLDLKVVGEDRFEGSAGRGEGRVFGGMMVAQGVVAAGRTVTDGAPHAVHATFLRPGRHAVPIVWQVERLRDGQQFLARRAVASQAGAVVFHLTASFVRAGSGLAHQDAMPAAPAPEGLPDWEDVRAALVGAAGSRRPDGPIEVRETDPAAAVPALGRPARRALWIRPRGVLPEEPLVHAAVLAYASDRALLGTAARPHGLAWNTTRGVSLDHALWLHERICLDDWVLYVTESPICVGGRALVLGGLYERTGRRIASAAQEGVIRAGR